MELPILISFLAFKYPRCVNRPNTIIPAEAKESPSFHSRAIIVYPKKSKGDPAIPMFELAGGAKTPRRELFSQLWLRSKSKSACLRTWETSAEVLIVDNIERRRRRRAARTEGRNGSGVRSGTRRRRRRSVFSCVHLRRTRTSHVDASKRHSSRSLPGYGDRVPRSFVSIEKCRRELNRAKKGRGAILWWEAEGEFCGMVEGGSREKRGGWKKGSWWRGGRTKGKKCTRTRGRATDRKGTSRCRKSRVTGSEGPKIWLSESDYPLSVGTSRPFHPRNGQSASRQRPIRLNLTFVLFFRDSISSLD